MGVTKKELAEELGVAKQTVVNYIDRLGLGDHVTRVGKYDVLDDFAASAIASAVGKAVPQKAVPPAREESTSSAVVAALNERIADLKDQNERLAKEISELKTEAETLRTQVETANARADVYAERLVVIAERQQALAALPWWKRGKLAMKLLGPGLG